MPATRHWSGLAGVVAGSYEWRDARNWAEKVAPVAGDDLVFGGQALTYRSDNNFPSNTVFNSISFPDYGAYTLSGNPIVLGSPTGSNPGIFYRSRDQVIVNLAAITLNVNVALSDTEPTNGSIGSGIDVKSPINVGSHTLTLSTSDPLQADFLDSNVSGTGPLVKTGNGSWGLYGNNQNFTGGITVNAGGLAAVSSTALGSPNVPAVVNNGGTLLFADFRTVGQPISVNKPLTISGSGNYDSGNGILPGAIVVGFFHPEGFQTFVSGPITLAGNATIYALNVAQPGTPVPLSLSSDINLGAFGLKLDGDLSTVLSGRITGSGTITEHGKTLVASGNIDGALNVTQGDLFLQKPAGQTFVPATLSAGSATLDPSVSVHFDLGNGSPGLPGSAGGGNLSSLLSGKNSVHLNNSKLATPTLNYVPPANTEFDIVTSNGSFDGTFQNAPPGALIKASNGVTLQVNYDMSGPTKKVFLIANPGAADLAFGGSPGVVHVGQFNGKTVADFQPFGAGYTGAVNVAIGDLNHDGIPDLVAAAAVGNPNVKVYDGKAFMTGAFDPNNPDASALASFFPYALSFNVGATVTVGDIEHNGYPDLVTGAAVGNPDVRVYRGRDIANHTFDPNGASMIAQFFPYALQFNVGANVAVGDVNRDGYADLVTGATVGNPDVRVYSGKDIATGHFDANGASQLAQFFAYGLDFNVGAFVAVGDTNGDGFGDVITGASSGNPQVNVYDGQAIARGNFNGNPSSQFFAAATGLNVGVAVAAVNYEGNGRADVLTGPTAGGGAHFRIFRVDGTGNPPVLTEGDLANFEDQGVAVGA